MGIGAEILRIYLDCEHAPEYPLTWLENRDVPFSWRVEKVRLSKDRTKVVVNPSLTLGDIPKEAFEYRLGNRSALEWVLDQYQISTDKRSGIITYPNREKGRGGLSYSPFSNHTGRRCVSPPRFTGSKLAPWIYSVLKTAPTPALKLPNKKNSMRLFPTTSVRVTTPTIPASIPTD